VAVDVRFSTNFAERLLPKVTSLPNEATKDSASYEVALNFWSKNSNQEKICHDFKFTLEEVLKIVVERCGTEPRAGHC